MVNARVFAPSTPVSSDRALSSGERGPGACPGCGRDVDPLRAGHVAILDDRFAYFCDATCKRAHFQAAGRRSAEHVPTESPPPVRSTDDPEDSPESHVLSKSGPRQERTGDPPTDERPLSDGPGVEAAPDTLASAEARPSSNRPVVPSDRRSDVVAAIAAAGIVVGALSPGVGLLGAEADAARAPLAVAAWVALLLRVGLAGRDPADPHPLVVLGPATGAVTAACWASVTRDPHAGGITVLAALACAVALVAEVLVARARVHVKEARASIERALNLRVRAVRGDGQVDVAASEVRAGEQIVVEPGEVVGVDATVTLGEARVVPWLDARVELLRREGDPVFAGATVVSSPLRMSTTWSGRERAWVRLLCSPATRIDVASPMARTLRHVVERGTPLAAVIVGLAAMAANSAPIEVFATVCAGSIAFGAKAASSFVALCFSRAHLEALRHGIVYKDAAAFDHAAAANVAVLNARGTVLMGEPEIVAVEAIGALDSERVLALAAGAEMAVTPFAGAALSAARLRGVRPDHVRNATVRPGLGITAVASTGERVVVGGRPLMLEEMIGVAVTDARASELEADGRSVLLVALGDRLVGIVVLQDGLRPGARAAVQRLLDARIEPVFLSGEARYTCEAIGRALDIDHVRPEVLPGDRGAEVRALAEGGNVVAVLGHPASDDGALGAADVAVAMGAAGSTPGDWEVVVASDDVRDAALALSIPHHARDRARIAIALGAAPGIVALLAIGFGLAPLAIAPIAALIGALAVAVQAREVGV